MTQFKPVSPKCLNAIDSGVSPSCTSYKSYNTASFNTLLLIFNLRKKSTVKTSLPSFFKSYKILGNILKYDIRIHPLLFVLS